MLETRLNIATRACQNDRNKEIIRNIEFLAWVVPQKSCGKEKSVNSIIIVANVFRMSHFEVYIVKFLLAVSIIFSQGSLILQISFLEMIKNYPPGEMSW